MMVVLLNVKVPLLPFQKMQLLPLAKSHYGTFHTEDAYIVYVAAERGKIASHDMPVG